MLLVGDKKDNRIRVGNGAGCVLEFLISEDDNDKLIKEHCQEFINIINKMDDESIQELNNLIKE